MVWLRSSRSPQRTVHWMLVFGVPHHSPLVVLQSGAGSLVLLWGKMLQPLRYLRLVERCGFRRLQPAATVVPVPQPTDNRSYQTERRKAIFCFPSSISRSLYTLPKRHLEGFKVWRYAVLGTVAVGGGGKSYFDGSSLRVFLFSFNMQSNTQQNVCK